MHNLFQYSDRPMGPWILIVLFCGYLLLALMLFNVIGLLAVLPFYDYSLESAMNSISGMGDLDEAKIPMLIVQGITSLGAFIFTPLFFIRVYLKAPIQPFFTISSNSPNAILITLITMMSFIVVNTVFIEWNMNMEFPEFLKSFENWARSKEDQLAELTKRLTEFDSLGHFLLGVLVISILAGVGEELVFRGLFQNIFFKALGNPHVAIWLSAFIFGAFHMQFFGILPRMLLGALFGYLYWWSGHLGYAMFAHFANNFFMLIMVYLFHQDLIEYDIESVDTTPQWWIILIFAVMTTLSLLAFYRIFNSRQNE